MLVIHHGWSMAEEAPSLMSQLMEVGTRWFARPLGSAIGPAVETQATSLPQWSAHMQSPVQPILFAPVVTPIMSDMCRGKYLPQLYSLFNLDMAMYHFRSTWSGLLQGCVLHPLNVQLRYQG